MTSLNNHPRGTHGSALVVTILLVSVMLTAALILLQRIIPYAKNVRSMHDAVQSYYTARGEAEAATLGFFYTNWDGVVAFRLPTLFRLLVATALPFTSPTTQILRPPEISRPMVNDGPYANQPRQSVDASGKIILLRLPNLADSTRENRDYAVSGANPNIPLQMKLFENDTSIRNFGTSKVDPTYHTLYSKNSGGIRFDLRGVKTKIADFFTLKIHFRTIPVLGTKLTVKMQYASSGTPVITKTFSQTIDTPTQDYFLTDAPANGTTQTVASDGSVTAEYNQTFKNFLDPPITSGCADATICSLTFKLEGTPSVDFQLISTPSTSPIPDLNAVVVGDGLSDNGLYFQRVIDLIPTKQDI